MNQISAGDTAWVLTSSALVMVMTVGLAFFYGGLVRPKNALNTMMMSVVALGVVGVQWTPGRIFDRVRARQRMAGQSRMVRPERGRPVVHGGAGAGRLMRP